MSGLSLPWAKVEKGMRVELNGSVWHVDKIKLKGKVAKVTVSGKGGIFTRELKAKDVVTIARKDAPRKPGKGPLRDESGRQTRWAKPEELGEPMPAGDPTVVKPPAKAKGGDWDEPKGKPEKVLAKIMGARLVGESTDEKVGYYVPPIDPSTVAAHMMLFHGGDAWLDHGEAELVKMHELQHEQARTSGAAFAVNHWHTKVRP